MERFVILLLLILILVTRYGRRKLGEAYCAAAKYAPTLELRREFSRKAVLAGNQEARKIFPITVARFAADHQPPKSVQKEENPMRIHGLLLPVKVQPIPERSTKTVLPILDHPYQRRKRVSMMKSRKTLIRRLTGRLFM